MDELRKQTEGPNDQGNGGYVDHIGPSKFFLKHPELRSQSGRLSTTLLTLRCHPLTVRQETIDPVKLTDILARLRSEDRPGIAPNHVHSSNPAALSHADRNPLVNGD